MKRLKTLFVIAAARTPAGVPPASHLTRRHFPEIHDPMHPASPETAPTSLPGSRRRLFRALILIAQTLLLASALAVWWSHRNNHLFANRQWIVGKNTGKFVFYTFEFMFSPLQRRQVNLSDAQGFQELLWHAPEGPNLQLDRLEVEVLLGRNSYLWVLLHRQGLQQLGCRITPAPDLQGWFAWDAEGTLTRRESFSTPPALPRDEWFRAVLARSDGGWVLTLNGQEAGRWEGPLPEGGTFGFRGSGDVRSPVLLRRISLQTSDPARPGRISHHRETFSSRPWRQRRLMLYCLALAAAVIALRRARSFLLSKTLSLEFPEKFTRTDDAFLLLCLGLALGFSRQGPGWSIPGFLALAELGSIAGLARARVHPGLRPGARHFWLPALLTAMLFAGATVSRHGEWLGRASRSVWARMNHVHPAAFLTFPPPRAALQPFTLSEPRRLLPGRPLFTGNLAFREQEIDVTFIPDPGVTVDLVWQQQSYRTLGDPEGEKLPLQRRLLRLSDRPGVATGLASETRTAPAPFFPVAGGLLPGEPNHLRIQTRGSQVTVTLNGSTSTLPGFPPLGFGETGIMAFGDGVEVTAFTVSPGGGTALRGRIRPVLGALLPAGLGLLLLLLLRPFCKWTVSEALLLGLTVFFPLAAIFVFTWALDTESLAFLGVTRLVWLNLALLGSALSLFHIFPLARGRLTAAPLLGNLLFLLLLPPALLFVWDGLLPEDHPLRLRFSGDAVAPAAPGADAPESFRLPWYSQNSVTVANTFLWHQQFGGRPFTLQPGPGTVRIFAMGGSQAWGSGAASSRETYDALLEQLLLAEDLPVEVLNAGINGAGIIRVSATFQGLIAGLSPDLLLLTVGLNDSAALGSLRTEAQREAHREILLEHFRSLLEFCRQQGVHVVLSLEAMSFETALRPDPALYGGLEALARAYGFTVLNTLEYMRGLEPGHLLWWDPAHLAPQGHQRYAQFLREPMAARVRERLTQPSEKRVDEGRRALTDRNQPADEQE